MLRMQAGVRDESRQAVLEYSKSPWPTPYQSTARGGSTTVGIVIVTTITIQMISWAFPMSDCILVFTSVLFALVDQRPQPQALYFLLWLPFIIIIDAMGFMPFK
jgi:hypothetical protein